MGKCREYASGKGVLRERKWLRTVSSVYLNTVALNLRVLPPQSSQNQSYITTSGQSASLFWCQAPNCDP
jgi:hypothetical protein